MRDGGRIFSQRSNSFPASQEGQGAAILRPRVVHIFTVTVFKESFSAPTMATVAKRRRKNSIIACPDSSWRKLRIGKV